MTRLAILILATTALIAPRCLSAQPLSARQPAPLPADLQPIAVADVPRSVLSVHSMQLYGIWPPIPLPRNWSGNGLDLYWSPSLQKLIMDDRAVDYAAR